MIQNDLIVFESLKITTIYLWLLWMEMIDEFMRRGSAEKIKIYICYVKQWICSHWMPIDGLVQERCNSIANALELHLSCTNPWIWTLYSVSLLHMMTLMTWHQDYCWQTGSVLWLLMPWLLVSSGHQQQWYRLDEISMALSPIKKDFRYRCCCILEEWYQTNRLIFVCFNRHIVA